MMTARERALFAELMWRTKHDVWRRSQFERLPGDAAYLCEGSRHLESVSAQYRRPPMPEMRARHAILFCADCWRRLPE